jgi:hypothetical protein
MLHQVRWCLATSATHRRRLALNGQTTINVQLTADSKSLNEVVVVGYGTQKKATLTGSISQVKGAELVKSPQPNLSNSIAGRFSGVIVNNRSGEPGVRRFKHHCAWFGNNR